MHVKYTTNTDLSHDADVTTVATNRQTDPL